MLYLISILKRLNEGDSMNKFYTVFLLIVFLLISGCTKINVNEEIYDVIIVGSDPEGIAAAISTARNGLNTLLVDKRDSVGGLFTHSWLNFLDMNYGPDKELLTRGVFQKFFDKVEGIAFDVQTAQSVLEELIENEENITLSLSKEYLEPIMKMNTIVGVKATEDNSVTNYLAKNVIDATQDGDIAALSGAKFTLGQEDIGGPSYGMAVTQVFKLGGIQNEHWLEIRRYLNNDGDVNSGSTHNTAWGFSELYQTYHSKNDNIQMRGLNIARQTDGCVMINALQIFAIDPLDEESVDVAKETALDELNYIIPFLQENIPGMKNISLLSVAPELYIRESRHFITEYRVTVNDLLEHRDFQDKIALGSYPVDLQGTSPGKDVIILGNPALYSIPLRATIPIDTNNLFIVGRSAGYDSLAHGSARVVPIGMCVAEGVGQAVSTLHKKGLSVEDLLSDNAIVDEIQAELINYGAYLPEIDYPAAIMDHQHYEGLKFLRKYGLIQGRYDNNYKLDEPMLIENFIENFNYLNSHLNWNIFLDIKDESKFLTKETLQIYFSSHPELISKFEQNTFYNQKDLKQQMTIGEAAILLLSIDNS